MQGSPGAISTLTSGRHPRDALRVCAHPALSPRHLRIGVGAHRKATYACRDWNYPRTSGGIDQVCLPVSSEVRRIVYAVHRREASLVSYAGGAPHRRRYRKASLPPHSVQVWAGSPTALV